MSEDPAQDGLNWYVYCGNNPVMCIDPSGEDAIVLTNEEGVYGLGHTGALVQDNDGTWYYFSFGDGYCQFEKVNSQYMSDIKTFSDNYYGGGTYTASTYIKGDFTNSYNYFSDFISLYNSGEVKYNAALNNCTQVVMDGINRGYLKDGTKIGKITSNYRGALPRVTQEQMENIFLNNAWTYTQYHSQLNNLTWDLTEGSKKHIWNKKSKLSTIKKLDDIAGL